MEDALKILSGGLVGMAATLIGGWALEQLRQRNRLRMAALDRRLEVHQDAYTRCHSILVLSLYGTRQEAFSYAKECADWWTENRVYLGPNTAKETDKLFVNVMEGAKISKDDLLCQGRKAIKAILDSTELPAMVRKEKWYGTQLAKPHHVDG